MHCDHPGCSCPPKDVERDGRRYCSAECAAQGSEERGAGACRCGHPGCQ
jgi:hypothetical protein